MSFVRYFIGLAVALGFAVSANADKKSARKELTAKFFYVYDDCKDFEKAIRKKEMAALLLFGESDNFENPCIWSQEFSLNKFFGAEGAPAFSDSKDFELYKILVKFDFFKDHYSRNGWSLYVPNCKNGSDEVFDFLMENELDVLKKDESSNLREEIGRKLTDSGCGNQLKRFLEGFEDLAEYLVSRISSSLGDEFGLHVESARGDLPGESKEGEDEPTDISIENTINSINKLLVAMTEFRDQIKIPLAAVEAECKAGKLKKCQAAKDANELSGTVEQAYSKLMERKIKYFKYVEEAQKLEELREQKAAKEQKKYEESGDFDRDVICRLSKKLVGLKSGLKKEADIADSVGVQNNTLLYQYGVWIKEAETSIKMHKANYLKRLKKEFKDGLCKKDEE